MVPVLACGRVDDPVEGRLVTIVRPPLHHVANIDDQRLGYGLHGHPLALPVVKLKTARVLRLDTGVCGVCVM